MDNQILVSVVLPIYNVEKYMDRCINSIINQTYKNLEIILVDDGSPDNCPQKCDDWGIKDSRIKVVHKKNAGLGMARNTGIENATGDYICFIDSDDYIELDTIETCIKKLTADHSDIAIYGFKSVNNDGTINKTTIPHSPKILYKGREVQDIFLPQLIAPIKGDWGIIMSSWCCLYNMKLINNTNFRFVSEREIIAEDVYSLLKLYKDVSGVSVISKAFYNYCVNDTSLTHTYRKDRCERIKHFYLESLELCKLQEYSKDVVRAMQGPYISFIIAAMKMIVKSDESLSEKMNQLKCVVKDEEFKKLLTSDELWIENKNKKLLFWAMRNEIVPMVYIFVRLK